MTITCRWLGAAGLEFSLDGYTLLVDPFFTRPGRLDILAASRITSNRKAVAQHITRADAVLVTHAHYDHLMDVPEVLLLTGAQAYGSPNTAALLHLYGWKASVIFPGDRVKLGPFSVEVFPARHTRIPAARWYNGPLPRALHLPLRLSDYRMDSCYSFRIRAGGQSLLVGNHPIPVDWLFIAPYQSDAHLGDTLKAIQPRVVAPIHWDDFTRPLDRPLRPMLLTPLQDGRWLPPIRHINRGAFEKMVHEAAPEARVMWMDLFAPNLISG